MRAVDKVPDLDSLNLFDSCVTLGRMVSSRYPEYLTKDNIIPMLDRYHIAEALVHEHHARLVYPREHGNRRLLEDIASMPRLHPVWVIEPPKQPGRDAAEKLIGELLSSSVKVARLPMKKAPPMLWLWKDLLGILEAHRIPCFLDFGSAGTLGEMTDSDVSGVRDIALAHPELPLVLSGILGGLGVHYGIVPLIRRVENLYIDIAGILEFWREVARDVGPDRVLFSTHSPFADTSLYLSNVQYARGLDTEAKRMICGDNLRHLMRDVR